MIDLTIYLCRVPAAYKGLEMTRLTNNIQQAIYYDMKQNA